MGVWWVVFCGDCLFWVVVFLGGVGCSVSLFVVLFVWLGFFVGGGGGVINNVSQVCFLSVFSHLQTINCSLSHLCISVWIVHLQAAKCELYICLASPVTYRKLLPFSSLKIEFNCLPVSYLYYKQGHTLFCCC